MASRLVATAPERYEGHFFRAMYYKLEGNLPSALDAAEAAVTRAAADCNPLILKGLILQQQGQEDAAQQAFAAAIKLEPERAAARQLLAASVTTNALSAPLATGTTEIKGSSSDRLSLPAAQTHKAWTGSHSWARLFSFHAARATLNTCRSMNTSVKKTERPWS